MSKRERWGEEGERSSSPEPRWPPCLLTLPYLLRDSILEQMVSTSDHISSNPSPINRPKIQPHTTDISKNLPLNKIAAGTTTMEFDESFKSSTIPGIFCSSPCILTRLRDGNSRGIRVSYRQSIRALYFLHNLPIEAGNHPASSLMGKRGSPTCKIGQRL